MHKIFVENTGGVFVRCAIAGTSEICQNTPQAAVSSTYSGLLFRHRFSLRQEESHCFLPFMRIEMKGIFRNSNPVISMNVIKTESIQDLTLILDWIEYVYVYVCVQSMMYDFNLLWDKHSIHSLLVTIKMIKRPLEIR